MTDTNDADDVSGWDTATMLREDRRRLLRPRSREASVIVVKPAAEPQAVALPDPHYPDHAESE